MQSRNKISPMLLLHDKQHPCGVRLVPFLAPVTENPLFKRRRKVRASTREVADDSMCESVQTTLTALDNFCPAKLTCTQSSEYTVARKLGSQNPSLSLSLSASPRHSVGRQCGYSSEAAPRLCHLALEWYDYDADLMPLDLNEDEQDDLMASYYSEIMSEEDAGRDECSLQSHCSDRSTVACTPLKARFSDEAETYAGVVSGSCAC